MKSNNFLVTYDDLSTMGLSQKTTPPTGKRVATKSFINTYYYVNNTGAFSAYSNNQCVQYQDIVGQVPNSGTFYYISYDGTYSGYNTSNAACSHTTGVTITAYWYGTLGNGTTLFSDTSGTALIGTNEFFYLNGYSFQLDGAAIFNFTPCSKTVFWSWTNNNVVEGSGGYILMYVNGSIVASQYDTGNYTTTNYSSSFTYNIGDSISVQVYSYANSGYGTETDLNIQSPSGTVIYNGSDVQPSPGSPSSQSSGNLYPTDNVYITASSNSY